MKTSLNLSRRRALQTAATGALLFPFIACRAPRVASSPGVVVGQPGAEQFGDQVLADGGNAFDAIVAAALAGAVMNPHQTGIGGYCMYGTFAVDGGKRIVCIDANSTAPAAMTPDIFKPGADGKVHDRINEFGWLATGVPGLMAGMALLIEKFGSRPFSAALAPAAKLCRDGFKLSPSSAGMIRNAAAALAKDPGSRKIYLPNGKPPQAGDVLKNPDLAAVLETLMRANSVEPFYRGDIAQRIADGYRKNGGIVTAKDLAAYRARIVEPLQLRWGDHTLFTGPITNGGITTLQILATLQALDWTKLPAGIERTHTQVEAMRLAWRDRLTLLGDPEFVSDPTKKLLSKSYAQECADRVRSVVKSGKTLAHAVTARDHGGTLSFSAVDRHGNFAALTLTHGNGFGARVTVDDLGLTLGHGMSRFDTDPQHPNAPAPGKRPLHNMAPFIVTRRGKPVVAIGGRGGRKIPNSVLEFLLQFVALGQPFANAMKAPRLHTEGDLVLEHEKAWPANEIPLLAKVGYRPKVGTPATLSGVIREGDAFQKAMR